MRYFITHVNLNVSDTVVPLCIYEVNEPKLVNGRWNASSIKPLSLDTIGTYEKKSSYIGYELYTYSSNISNTKSSTSIRLEQNSLIVRNGDLVVRRQIKTTTTTTKHQVTSVKTDVEKDEDLLVIPANTWEVGAKYSSSNYGESYCFYCKQKYDDYMKISSANQYKVHDINSHNGSSSNVSVGSSDHSNLTNGESNTNISYRGTQEEGKALVPYLMLTLSPNSKSAGFNLSIPANNFIDMTHERNLADSYNTFNINLFDKDATQIESKLIQGFRTVSFYYTDFVSSSRRFYGEILKYKSVITGKGLMLSITGYASSVISTVNQDSIPWNILADVGSYGLYYWTNNNNDYYGYVCQYIDDKGKEHYTSDLSKENSSYVKYPSLGDLKDKKIYLEGWDENNSNLSDSDKDLYKPYAVSWSLMSYTQDISTVLGNNWNPKKPSDIVKAICIINKWKFDENSIEETTEVDGIKEQINISSTEYIKNSLIPISTSASNKRSQYYFWIDDNGVANYRTDYSPQGTNQYKKFVFNQGKEKEDTYQLISFVSEENGAIAMLVNGSNTMGSTNIYTGDDTEASIDNKVVGSTTTASWIVGNKYTQDKNQAKIVYSEDPVTISEADLNNKLAHRYSIIAQNVYKSELQVWGCTDVAPGDIITIEIYLDEDLRKYVNSGLHHTSGTYRVLSMVDSVSGGKFISTLKCYKMTDSKDIVVENKDISSDYNVTSNTTTYSNGVY